MPILLRLSSPGLLLLLPELDPARIRFLSCLGTFSVSKSDGSDPLLVVDDERLVWCRSMFAGCEEDSTLELLVLLELLKDSPSTRFEGAEPRLLVKSLSL